MKPVVTVPMGAFAGLGEDAKAALAKRITAAMRTEGRALEKDVERATSAAGLGKLAKTWNSRVFPDGKDATGPAIWVWSKAPLPMRAFTEGVTIRGKDGGWLAIPTPEAARFRGVSRDGGNRRQRITPGGFERATGMKLRFVYTGTNIAFLIATGGVRHRNAARGFRVRTDAEARRGRREERFLAFWLIRQVTLRKRIDLASIVNPAIARIKGRLAEAVKQAATDITRAPRRAA